ncbi:uncharacterized protein LOC105786958 [Gossypium raimondii]|uniref:uncharacterized protein LOC105786958 n=1 Tax=Gossypium raimondii TaxID=29730 RepID=UPI00063AE327|nr:uncharacterized protein LOC105786958 [Gossypium raimondii]
MFDRLSLFDDGNLLTEFQVKPTWIDQIRDKQLGDDSFVLRFRLVKDGSTSDFWVSSSEKVLRLGRNDKLSYMFIGLYRILKRMGSVACQIELPLELDFIHDVFHVSMLRKYRSNPSHVVSVEEIEVRLDLTFEEEQVQILDRDIKLLRSKSIRLVKVLWQNHDTKKATWELEDSFRQQYSHLG